MTLNTALWFLRSVLSRWWIIVRSSHIWTWTCTTGPQRGSGRILCINSHNSSFSTKPKKRIPYMLHRCTHTPQLLTLPLVFGLSHQPKRPLVECQTPAGFWLTITKITLIMLKSDWIYGCDHRLAGSTRQLRSTNQVELKLWALWSLFSFYQNTYIIF